MSIVIIGEREDLLKRYSDPASVTHPRVSALLRQALAVDHRSAVSAAVNLCAHTCEMDHFSESELADCIRAQQLVLFGGAISLASIGKPRAEVIELMRRYMDPNSIVHGQVVTNFKMARRIDHRATVSGALGLLALACQFDGLTRAEVADCIAGQRRACFGQTASLRPERTFKPGGITVPESMLKS